MQMNLRRIRWNNLADTAMLAFALVMGVGPSATLFFGKYWHTAIQKPLGMVFCMTVAACAIGSLAAVLAWQGYQTRRFGLIAASAASVAMAGYYGASILNLQSVALTTMVLWQGCAVVAIAEIGLSFRATV